MICSTPRSGSSFLCDALARTELAGKPYEYFLPWQRASAQPDDLDPYARDMCALSTSEFVKRIIQDGTCNGVFGVKMMQSYFGLATERLRELGGADEQSAAELLESCFPRLRYIFLTRDDKVRQAISLEKAIQSDEWESYRWSAMSRLSKRLRGEAPRFEYDFAKLASIRDMLVAEESNWESFFEQSGIQPFRVTYESFVRSFDTTIREILDFLGIPYSRGKRFRGSKLRRQSDIVNEEWVLRFEADSLGLGDRRRDNR